MRGVGCSDCKPTILLYAIITWTVGSVLYYHLILCALLPACRTLLVLPAHGGITCHLPAGEPWDLPFPLPYLELPTVLPDPSPPCPCQCGPPPASMPSTPQWPADLLLYLQETRTVTPYPPLPVMTAFRTVDCILPGLAVPPCRLCYKTYSKPQPVTAVCI